LRENPKNLTDLTLNQEYHGVFERILWLRNKLKNGKNFQSNEFDDIKSLIQSG
jgi:hypothetical protein